MSISLKVMINKEKTKVIFAEADSDFINVLLSFLTLPLGKILKNDIPLGSLNTLRTSLSSLSVDYFGMPGAKEMLLDPQSSFAAECRKLALDITGSLLNNRLYLCQDPSCPESVYRNVSVYNNIATCECGEPLTRSYCVIPSSTESLDAGLFTISHFSFIITDDLRVAPIAYGIIQTLTSLGVTDTGGAEMQCLSFGAAEITQFLKFCLTSATPLTEMVLKKTGVSSSSTAKPEPRIMSQNIPKSNKNSTKMALRVCLQKSTNKFLYAEAMDDFLEFLCSFISIPLAGVEFLLGGNTGLRSIDNLYRSVAIGIDAKYFTTPDIRGRLINPKLAHGYGFENQILPLSQDCPPRLYYKERSRKGRVRTSFYDADVSDSEEVSSFKSSKSYVKKQTMCFIGDDLTVSPCLATSISILDRAYFIHI